MALRYLFDRHSGIMHRVFYENEETGELVVETKFNQALILENLEDNKREANAFIPHKQGEVFRKVAEIPPEIAELFMAEKGVDIYTDEGMDYFITKVLNDHDYKYLKTVPDNYRIKPQS